MKLIDFCATDYKSIENSSSVKVDQVTCLVGKNEAGKTALFETLYKLHPIKELDGSFRIEDYPRRKMNAYKKHHDANPATAIIAKFKLSEQEYKSVLDEYGNATLTSPEFTLEKKYNNGCYYVLSLDEKAFLKHLMKKFDILGDLQSALSEKQTLSEFHQVSKEKAKDTAAAKQVCDYLDSFKSANLTQVVAKFIEDKFLPEFFYFDDYSILPGDISLNRLKEVQQKGTDDKGLLTALSLIRLVGSTIDEFLQRENYEKLKASLEAASNAITDKVFEYWTQNKELEVEFDLEAIANKSTGRLDDTILHIRIKNRRHRVTVPFDKRSKGFVWFFSFLVAFSDYQNKGESVILLLDEPGLNLHGKAQFDLLRFIDQELAPYHQVLYTTHSPFMIPPAKLERVRTVHDRDNLGTVVSNDPLSDDPDTVFPLQAALGYDLAQSLFLGPNTLVVEGPGDLIYFNIATTLLEKESCEGLSNKWVVVPVGGADKIPTFVSLLGANQLNVAVAVDVSQKERQRIDNLIKNHFLKKNNLVTIGDIANSKNADIEDLFSADRYLDLVNGAYEKELSGKKIKLSDLSEGEPRIIKRLEEYFKKNLIAGGVFSHYRPAHYLIMTPNLADKIFDAITRKRFETLFKKINPLLKGFSTAEVEVSVAVEK